MHKINILQGSARWLAIYMNQPQIFTTTAQVWCIGLLIASHLDDAANLKKDIANDDEKFREWGLQPHAEFEISEAQRDAVKHGLGQLASKGLLTPNKWTIELLEAFGLKP